MSTTLEEQYECEVACTRCIQEAKSNQHKAHLMAIGLLDSNGEPRLMREKHVAYLERGLNALGPGYVSLDARWEYHSRRSSITPTPQSTLAVLLDPPLARLA